QSNDFLAINVTKMLDQNSMTDDGEALLEANDGIQDDGNIVASCVSCFLRSRQCPEQIAHAAVQWSCAALERPVMKEEGLVRDFFAQVKGLVIPYLKGGLCLDYTGIILAAMCAWGNVGGDEANDVVLTPKHARELMVELAHTDMDSYVWDRTMGTGGFLLSAMDVMLRDAREKIQDDQALQEKIRHIRADQIFGMESLPGVYVLSVLNMVLSGGDPASVAYGDSHQGGWGFPATVLLLNPPYSAEGKGLDFAEEAFSHMASGYASVLIQENAGSGQGGVYPARILQKNTLLASIHMPVKLFGGKVNVLSFTEIGLRETPFPCQKAASVFLLPYLAELCACA
ncbi:MAG: SAM-dependent methyltransferase, partial [Clostridiales bacterium]|nr:SAM-dependent methyltransferase [Clostridiales bacterium]